MVKNKTLPSDCSRSFPKLSLQGLHHCFDAPATRSIYNLVESLFTGASRKEVHAMKKEDTMSAFASCTKRQGASQSLITNLEIWVGKALPPAYVELMASSNGIEGFIGATYLILWPVEQLKELNEGYAIGEFAPGLFLIGSNGGDSGFALDTRHEPMEVKEVPFIGLSHEATKTVATSFKDFVEFLKEKG